MMQSSKTQPSDSTFVFLEAEGAGKSCSRIVLGQVGGNDGFS